MMQGHSQDAVHECLEVNTLGALRMMDAFMPQMLSRGYVPGRTQVPTPLTAIVLVSDLIHRVSPPPPPGMGRS
jgi:NAD(P)-dependent dehydrogenase (short-subunit alcohol dehydrogenase family)